MCGRYTRKETTEEIIDRLNAENDLPEQKASYDIAPSQQVLTIRNRPGKDIKETALLKWGLVPKWVKEPSIGYKMINARVETVAEKPSFRLSFKKRRCIELSDGFYNWRRARST